MADKTDAAVSNNDAAKDDAKVDTPVADAAPTTPATPAADTASTSDAKNTDADAGDKKDGDKMPAAAPAPTIEQSLEEGIGNVVKGFGSIWGVMKARVSTTSVAQQRMGVPKDRSSAKGTVRALLLQKLLSLGAACRANDQSANTLKQVQTQANKTYQQLQDDMKTLQETKVEVTAKNSAQWEAEQEEAKRKKEAAAEAEAKAKAEAAEDESSEDPSDPKGKGKARARDTPEAGPIADAEATARSLFSRLSTQTSALQNTLQSSLSTTLASARASGLDDPAALRARLAENLRLSELKLSLQQAEKLAEGYVAKGRGAAEAWAAEAERWVEENVKVVPPPSNLPSGGFDAGEWYAFTTSAPATGPATPRTESPAPGLGPIAGSRKEALLARLRADTALLLVDPAAETESKERREEYAKWIRENAEKIPGEKEKEVGNVGEIRMALVPEQLDDGEFWTRYLFHRDMIEEQEKRRKALLMGKLARAERERQSARAQLRNAATEHSYDSKVW
ncbi:hypothetical protein A1Q2_04098 [Trichosporon asahii var. asahii CBS 8904]|uniref:BSD domain-containing protein n=2 Tax=Trichosporon asahii var. asahii TaxID=189963 RepID=K1VQ23_TRIAC|nr:hypothetical protein A1Q1_00236 [Trichosporon asahii var. asahii CBS 2479]EJT50449.1 hypothetical protein A1Q1_00236 [Trichosporon asahii var. asahii CBS 2479]EKD01537.1 hypothetical protein A1Q2_04098 [Trichosporon asahii var. asahii CBS 8904]